jgi:hypothetical protein
MKNWLSVLLLVVASLAAFSQDAIYKTDGTKIDGIVTLVAPTEIRYKAAANPDGPEYIIPTNNIVIIVYKNGTYDLLKKKSEKEFLPFDSLTINYGKNIIFMNLAALVPENLFFSYERIINHGYIGLRSPFILGLMHGASGNNKTIGTGLDINFYPFKQGRVRYFVGPSFEVGMKKFYYPYSGQYGYYYNNTEETERSYYNLHINNGLMFQITKYFNISAVAGVGVQAEDYGSKKPRSNGTIEFNMGFRF